MFESIRFGFSAVFKNARFVLALTVLMVVLFWGPYTVALWISNIAVGLGFVIHMADIVLTAILFVGLIHVALTYLDTHVISFNLFSRAVLFLGYIVIWVLRSLLLWLGTLLLVIPGIVWALKYSFATWVLVDEGCTSFEAMRRSSVLTKGRKWRLFFFFLLLGCINIFGAMLLGIGLLVTGPASLLAMGYVYRWMTRQPATD